MEKYIDLHMHSAFSDDGEFTPESLVNQCHKAAITIMSIADHNSVRANQEARKIAELYGIQYITGIEIDCTYQGLDLHVLGYGFNDHHVDFYDLENYIIQQELSVSSQKILMTNNLGFSLTKADMDQVSQDGIYTGEMFGEVLLNKPEYINHELLIPYREGGNRSDNPYVNFYWDYYSQGKPCYSEIKYPTLKEVLALIHRHGGVSVLAHPGKNLSSQFELVDDMIEIGLQGIEVFSNYHDLTATNYFYQKAKKHHLLITCGSDFHGKTKPAIQLGECRCSIDESLIELQLKQYQLI